MTCVYFLPQVDFGTVQRLVKKRGKVLKVMAGDTDGDGMAASMIMEMMGREYGDGIYGNYRDPMY